MYLQIEREWKLLQAVNSELLVLETMKKVRQDSQFDVIYIRLIRFIDGGRWQEQSPYPTSHCSNKRLVEEQRGTYSVAGMRDFRVYSTFEGEKENRVRENAWQGDESLKISSAKPPQPNLDWLPASR